MKITSAPIPSDRTINEVMRQYEEDEPPSAFYVNKESGLIYEIKFFEDFVMLRLAVSNFTAPVDRMDHLEFAEEYEEYAGDMEELNSVRFGKVNSYFTIDKR